MIQPPPRPVLPDTEPAPLDDAGRSRPGAESDLAPWSDSDVHLAAGPAVAFAKNAAAASDEQMPTVGHIGRYALKYPIGEGGLGTVYAAHDPLLSRLIAIKTLNLELDETERESFNQLFLNEARAAAALSHPHIVTVHDAGVSDQGAYIAMELLKGRDLRLLRQEGWRPTHMQAALIVRRVADALAYAHSKGVIHLDIKPANIFMVGRTQPKVLDFGIARIAHRHDAVGHDGLAGDFVAGSPHYMAPEQIREQPVDRRADVFSLGVVLYELLTDQKPFVGQTLSEITGAVLEVDPPMAHLVDPTVPRPLAEIAQRALQKDPEARYRSARSLARDLRHWLDEHAQATEPPEEVAVKAPPPSRRFGLLAWAAAAGLALTVSTAMWTALAPTGERAEVARTEPRQGAVVGGLVAPAPAVTPPAGPTAAPQGVASGGAAGGPAAAPPAVPLATPAPPSRPAPAQGSGAVPAGPTALAQPPAQQPSTAPGAAPDLSTAAVAAAPSGAGRATTGGASNAPAAGPAPTREPRPAADRPRPVRETSRAGAPAAATAAPATASAASLGEVRIAVSPWGEVEVDGASKGTTPPLNVLRLPEGRHQIVIRNADFPPYATSVVVRPGESVTVRHRFGS